MGLSPTTLTLTELVVRVLWNAGYDRIGDDFVKLAVNANRSFVSQAEEEGKRLEEK